MSNKLALQDLVDLLAKKSKITKKEADSFFREFFQLILDRIFENDSVKIKDFGTFKLVAVSSRESVDVNTGEKIEIRAHYKLSFVPDKTLKNLVNKPFSQFETILLEDGVDFDSSDDTDLNDDISEDDEKEYIIDIPQEETVSNNPKETKMPEDKPEEAKKDIEQPIKDKVEGQPVRPTTPPVQYPSFSSYSYTYTVSSTEKKPDSITITLPKEDLVSTSANTVPPVKEDKTPAQDYSIQPEKQPEPKQVEEVKEEYVPQDVESNTVSAPIKTEDKKQRVVEEMPTPDVVENEIVTEATPQDKIKPDTRKRDSEKQYIEPIVPSRSELELDDLIDVDSEIETEDDVTLPPAKVLSKPSEEKPVDASAAKSNPWDLKHISDDDKIFTDEDPERPLLRDDDIVISETDFLDIEDSDNADKNIEPVVNQVGNNKPTTIRSVAYSENIDDVEIPYHDYYAPTLGDKIKKVLPWTLLGLVVLGFIAYNVIPLFNVKYDYENKLDRLNLTTSDTLPLIDETDDSIAETSSLLDSLKTNRPADSVKVTPAALPANVAPVPAKQDAASKKTHVPDREISKNLKIEVINKAQMYLLKYPPKTPKAEVTASEAIANKTEEVKKQPSKPKYDVIRRGVTLRNLSTKHYGNGDFWVYIYQANKSRIQNPNRVPIGTNLVIPDLDDYGVSSTKDQREIQKAKNLAERILR